MASQRRIFRLQNYVEERYGFAQAVRVGDIVHVAGQTGVLDDGTVDGEDDVARQMRRAYVNVRRALEGVGASMHDVVDETVLVTDMAAAVPIVQKVRAEAFGSDIQIASTLLQVAALGSPRHLVEIKCTAIVS